MNTTKSVFYWRLLLIMTSALLLANFVSAAAYAYFGSNAFLALEKESLAAQARFSQGLLEEHMDGSIDRPTLHTLLLKQCEAENLSVIITKEDGRIFEVVGSDQISEELFYRYFDEVRSLTSTDRPFNRDLKLENGQNTIAYGLAWRAAPEAEPLNIFVFKEQKMILTSFYRILNTGIWMIMLSMPILLLLTGYTTRQLSSPLIRMANVAISISKGKYDVRADENAPGEIGIMARALNTLTAELSQSIYQLQNEKRQLNHILSSFDDGVAAVDDLGCLTHYNPALKKMFGAVIVQSCMDLVPDESVWKTFSEVFETGKSTTMNYTLPGDRKLWITIVPVKDEQNNCTGVVGLFKDVTEFERLEQTRRDYVANVSHELRTPLTAVRGLLEPLNDGLVRDESAKKRYYGIMLREVERLSRLITDLLQLSRLQSGTEYMQMEAVPVREIFEDVRDKFLLTAEKNGVNLQINTDGDPYAMTDRDRIEQVLVVLCDNALRYTPAGGSVTMSLTSGDVLLVSVTDTGCGISPQELPHLFERFYKVDKSRHEGGTGLGLAIAKQIIDKLGEQIYVESEEGKGTSFHFTLKRYVSNAIALGPSGEEVYYGAHEEKKDRNELDAPYEVIDPVRKGGSSKKKLRL